MPKPLQPCCTSPASLCYWFVVSLIAWGFLSLVGIYWTPLRAPSPAACLFAMAIGCFANWFRNRSFHCIITAPLFLIAALLFLFSAERIFRLNTRWIWPAVLLGTALAFLLEFRYATRSPS